VDHTTADDRDCRTCGRPRGANIADGTRCTRCGRRHALLIWIAAVVAAAEWTLFYGGPVDDAIIASLVTLVSLPPAFVGAVLLHELLHAVVGRLQGQTITRVLVGEGHAVLRFGREPEFVLGSVVLGNGLTSIMDLRPIGYRWRMTTSLLAAPLGSLTIGVTAWTVSAAWPFPARTAVRVFALGNLFLALVTLIPVATFGARVWSDLAVVRFLWRASDAQIVEQMLQSVQDRLAILLERDDPDAAIATAREAVAVAPEAPLAHSLLSFTLLQAGHREEASCVARAALERAAVDEDSRTYLRRIVEEAERPSAGTQ